MTGLRLCYTACGYPCDATMMMKCDATATLPICNAKLELLTYTYVHTARKSEQMPGHHLGCYIYDTKLLWTAEYSEVHVNPHFGFRFSVSRATLVFTPRRREVYCVFSV